MTTESKERQKHRQEIVEDRDRFFGYLAFKYLLRKTLRSWKKEKDQ